MRNACLKLIHRARGQVDRAKKERSWLRLPTIQHGFTTGSPNRCAILGLVVLFVCTSVSAARATEDVQAVPAEESRLGADKFYEGLRKRGLTELLELHLREFAPADASQTLKLMRDIKLADAADVAKSPAERKAALTEANKLLEQAIAKSTDASQRLEWKLVLAQSLIYEEGLHATIDVLFRAGGSRSRTEVLGLTTRALAALASVDEDLSKEFERVDALSPIDFDKLEQSGWLDSLERMQPKSESLKIWTTFFDACARGPSDILYADRLHSVFDSISRQPARPERPNTPAAAHTEQLLMKGMCHRRLNDLASARQELSNAFQQAELLASDPKEKSHRWMATLAAIEGIRNDADDRKYDEAQQHLNEFRAKAKPWGDDAELDLTLALLERDIARLRASDAKEAPSADRLQPNPLQQSASFVSMLRDDPNRRDQVYSLLHGRIELNTSVNQLDPLEQCATLARLLRDADDRPNESTFLLQRALEAGNAFLASVTNEMESFVPEVQYNLAIVLYRMERLNQATERFLIVARDHPSFEQAAQAAALATQLAFEMLAEEKKSTADTNSESSTAKAYFDAIGILCVKFSQTDAAKRWRFHYGAALDDAGKHEQAAQVFSSIDESHEHYLDALYRRTVSIARWAGELSRSKPGESAEIRRLFDEFQRSAEKFESVVKSSGTGSSDKNRAASFAFMQSNLLIQQAQLLLLPGVDRPDESLTLIGRFESEHAAENSLLPDVWRVRLLAFGKLGRLDEAAASIPKFVTADPQNSGPILQSLYLSIANDVDAARQIDDENAEARKAELAWLLAKHVFEWTEKQSSRKSRDVRRSAEIQLGEACLRAGQYAEAKELFERLAASEMVMTPTPTAAVQLGLAEARFKMDDFADVLPVFNRFAMALPPSDPVRWKALLRDLQCRVALKHPADGVLSVIKQQRILYPDMGGPAFARQFDQLEREASRGSGGK